MQKLPDPYPEGHGWLEPVPLGDDEAPILADLAAHGMPIEALDRTLRLFLCELKALADSGNGRAGVTDLASLALRLRSTLAKAVEAASKLAEALSGEDDRTRARLELLGWDDQRVREAAAAVDHAFVLLAGGAERDLDGILSDLAALEERQRVLIARQRSVDERKRVPALGLIQRLRERWETVHGEMPRRKAFVQERDKRSDGTPRRVGFEETVTPAAFGLFIDRLCALRAMAPLAELLANDFALSLMLRELDDNERANRVPSDTTK